jgi:C4-type Zn-finger protein
MRNCPSCNTELILNSEKYKGDYHNNETVLRYSCPKCGLHSGQNWDEKTTYEDILLVHKDKLKRLAEQERK